MSTQTTNTESSIDKDSSTEKVMPFNGEDITQEAKGRAASALMSINSGARFMWHTTLGSIVTAEQKLVGTAIDMAKRGSEFEATAKTKVSEQASTSSSKLRQRTQKSLGGVEKAFDASVDRSLHFLGVPTQRDMAQLSALIQDLTDSVNELAGKTGGNGAKPAGNSAGKAKRSKSSSPTTTA